MQNLKEYIEDREEIFNEDAATLIGSGIGSTLGLMSAGVIIAWTVSLFAMALAKGAGVVIKNLKAAGQELGLSREQFISLKDAISKGRGKPAVKTQTQKTNNNIREHEEELATIYDAIDNDNYDLAHQEYMKLSTGLRAMSSINDSLIAVITKKTKTPPIRIPSPGNVCYKRLRQVCGIRIAKAAAMAVEMSMKKLAGDDEDDNK